MVMQTVVPPEMSHLRRVETVRTSGRIPLELTQFDAAPHRTPDPESDNYILCLALRGTVRAGYRFGDRWRQAVVAPGSFMPITPPRTLGEFVIDAPHRHLMLALPRRAVIESCSSLDPFGPLHAGAFQDKLAAQICVALWDDARTNEASDDLFADCLREALIAALRRRAGERPMAARAQPSFSAHVWTRIEDEIEARLAEPLTVAMLAAHSGLRETRFLQAFRAKTGMSPYRYVLHKRIERARHLLVTSRLGLAEVALASGFSDQAHMTTSLSRHLGLTPGAIRRAGDIR